MKSFTGIFAEELNEYIQLRGKEMTAESLRSRITALYSFDQFTIDASLKTKAVPEELVSRWIKSIEPDCARRTVNEKISVLRCFFRYLSYLGYTVFIPNCQKTTDSYVPYVFSDDELTQIFSAADDMRIPFRGRINTNLKYQMPVYLRILYGCGLRSGEVTNLKVKDIRFDIGVIVVRKAKNNKQRLVPMDPSLTEILQKYCIAIGNHGMPDAYLFSDKDGEQLKISAAESYFLKILKATNIYKNPLPHTRGQCIHCFRHVFAIRSFAQAEANGRTVADSIPYLSVYLGHFDMDCTEKYLKFSSDMFPEYYKSFEDYSSKAFPEVTYEA